MSRLSIDLTGDQHQQIKVLASMQGKSIKEYIVEKIFPSHINNEEQKAWEELQNLLISRIEEAENVGVSGKTFEQITEEIIQSRKDL